MSVFITDAFHLHIKRRIQHVQAGSYSAESNSRKGWKSETEVEADESGGRTGSGRASNEPKAGASWRGIKHELMPMGKENRCTAQ